MWQMAKMGEAHLLIGRNALGNQAAVVSAEHENAQENENCIGGQDERNPVGSDRVQEARRIVRSARRLHELHEARDRHAADKGRERNDGEQKLQKEAVVAQADAAAHPRAVVIKVANAHVAVGAVLGARRAIQIARLCGMGETTKQKTPKEWRGRIFDAYSCSEQMTCKNDDKSLNDSHLHFTCRTAEFVAISVGRVFVLQQHFRGHFGLVRRQISGQDSGLDKGGR